MKKIKKSSRNAFFKGLFWCFAIGLGAWLVFSPPPKHPATVVHSKVEQAHNELPPEKPDNLVDQPMPEQKPFEQPLRHPGYGDEQAQSPEPAHEDVQPQMVVPPHNVKDKQPLIAIVIDDVGLDLRGSQRASNLPDYITLSFMPYATRLHEQTSAARDKGHELLLHMPMEPLGNADPGPGALLTDLSADDIRARFQTALASFTGFDGVNNHMGSKFTADKEGMAIVMDELKQRHLFFLDSRTSPKSVGFAVAREHTVPTLSRDIFLDDDQSPRLIKQQLEQTEIVARRKGYAIAIGHPHAVTLELLEKWLPDAEAKGYKFVALNSFIRF